jgi:hypothetical protein
MSATKPHLEATEAELLQRACRGDKEAFYNLVRPCERAVYTAAISILNNPEDAEEVAQEAVLKGAKGAFASGGFSSRGQILHLAHSDHHQEEPVADMPRQFLRNVQVVDEETNLPIP